MFTDVQLTMDDGSSEKCFDEIVNCMNFKNIVWFIKAISYFVLHYKALIDPPITIISISIFTC